VADGEYGLLLGFDTDDPQFTRGFELGRIWEIAKTFDGPFEEIVHGVNAEMLIRIARRPTGRCGRPTTATAG
jgi:hypothetical protein